MGFKLSWNENKETKNKFLNNFPRITPLFVKPAHLTTCMFCSVVVFLLKCNNICFKIYYGLSLCFVSGGDEAKDERPGRNIPPIMFTLENTVSDQGLNLNYMLFPLKWLFPHTFIITKFYLDPHNVAGNRNVRILFSSGI